MNIGKRAAELTGLCVCCTELESVCVFVVRS
jgi:hypothetical protein